MSDGKVSSTESDSDDKKRGEDATKGPAPRMGGRFRAPTSSAIDLPAYTPDDDDDVVDEVAKRFRAGPRLGAPVLDEQESLDEQTLDSEDIDEGSVLDALESPPSQKLTESTEAGKSPSSEEFPEVDVEPISTGGRGDEPEGHPRVCPSCHAENSPEMQFCVECGGSLKAPERSHGGPELKKGPTTIDPIDNREPPPASEAADEENPWDIRMVAINEDGTDGTSIPLEYMETTIGRDGDDRFPTDAFLSPKHARFHIEDGALFIEDLYSLNGTFIKLRDETRLTPGDTILMGRQVLRFERFEQSITPKTKSSNGTRYMGSPAPGGSFKVLQVGIGGVVQNVYCLPESGAVLGREKGDIVFPNDKFMSGRHAQIYSDDEGGCHLVDLNSSNGTWIKIWEKTRLEGGDYIFMGQQLFRVGVDD